MTCYLRVSDSAILFPCWAGVTDMRTVEEYLEKAKAFEELVAAAANDLIRASYADIARAYRDLARERLSLLRSNEQSRRRIVEMLTGAMPGLGERS